MQPSVDSLEKILAEEDLLSIQFGVNEIFQELAKEHAPPEAKAAFCDLLLRKANESSNRVLTHYLRSVAYCMEPSRRGQQLEGSRS